MDKEHLADLLNDYVESVSQLQNIRSRNLTEATEEANFNLYLFMNALEEEMDKMIAKKVKRMM